VTPLRWNAQGHERALRRWSGGACRRVGEQLGINADTLRGRVKRAQIDVGVRPGVTASESARIRELEKEKENGPA
jgi:hypothetical protein